jgi:hypothetical protein
MSSLVAMGWIGLGHQPVRAGGHPWVRETTMIDSALAMYVGAILFRRPGENSGQGHGGEELGSEQCTVSERWAASGVRRLAPGDPALVEDDYYRFLNQPRG